MLPNRISSMLGCVAAVMDTESPSHPNNSEIHTIWTSSTFAILRLLVGRACASPIPAVPNNKKTDARHLGRGRYLGQPHALRSESMRALRSADRRRAPAVSF